MQREKGENTHINLKKKPFFPVSHTLRKYLKNHGRLKKLPIAYDDLMKYDGSFPYYNKQGKDTLWETVHFNPLSTEKIHQSLAFVYSLLKTDGDTSVMEHLYVDRIDYCSFGNSNPFRVRIVNQLNDNFDYFYVKKADSSRIYGLELEHILSPNRINYLVYKDTIIEEHIAGIPGDVFMNEYMQRKHFKESSYNKVRIAKEFVKFNERCFIRLLGDMRSYNYVIDVTPDFEGEQYRIRAIDFDQQSYEGKRTLYLPQFFKENNQIVNFCIELMTPQTVKQYQYEERTLMTRRYRSAKNKIRELIAGMCEEQLSTNEKIEQLKNELNAYHHTEDFFTCTCMGDIVRVHLKLMLDKSILTTR